MAEGCWHDFALCEDVFLKSVNVRLMHRLPARILIKRRRRQKVARGSLVCPALSPEELFDGVVLSPEELLDGAVLLPEEPLDCVVAIVYVRPGEEQSSLRCSHLPGKRLYLHRSPFQFSDTVAQQQRARHGTSSMFLAALQRIELFALDLVPVSR